MRVLEARFHPPRSGQDYFILVAHVVWEKDSDGPPSIRPVRSLWALGAPATMLSKLQFLVVNSGPETFTRLKGLRSEAWSFVDITPP
jgi:hypothetical protein